MGLPEVITTYSYEVEGNVWSGLDAVYGKSYALVETHAFYGGSTGIYAYQKIAASYQPVMGGPIYLFGFKGIGNTIPVKKQVLIKNSMGQYTVKGTGNSKFFKNQDLLNSHFSRHGTEIQKALGKNSYNISNYLDDANFVIKNGTYVKELNGYVRFIGGQKYGFVGLDRITGAITTFHIKKVSELIKTAPSLGLSK